VVFVGLGAIALIGSPDHLLASLQGALARLPRGWQSSERLPKSRSTRSSTRSEFLGRTEGQAVAVGERTGTEATDLVFDEPLGVAVEVDDLVVLDPGARVGQLGVDKNPTPTNTADQPGDDLDHAGILDRDWHRPSPALVGQTFQPDGGKIAIASGHQVSSTLSVEPWE